MTKLILMRNPNKPNEVIDPMDFTRELIDWHKQAIKKAIDNDDMDKLHSHHVQLNEMQIRMIELRRSFTTNLN